jgi:HEAT repeat protein
MAALALGTRRVASSQPILIEMAAADASPYARRAAAYALGLLGDPAALPALERVAEDPDSNVAANARAAIEMLRSKVEPVSGTVPEVVKRAVTTISTCAERDPRIAAALATVRELPESAALPMVTGYLADDRNTIRRAAILILSHGPFHSIDVAIGQLKQLCRHSEDVTRGMAALALGTRRVASSRQILIEMATADASPYARRAAAYALGLLGDPNVLPALEGVARDPDPNVAANARASIEMLRSTAKP